MRDFSNPVREKPFSLFMLSGWSSISVVSFIEMEERGLLDALLSASSSKSSIKKFVVTGDGDELVANPPICSSVRGTENEDISTWQKSLKLSSSKCWLRRFRTSLCGTLMKSETASKLNEMSLWLTRRVSSVRTNFSESLTCVVNDQGANSIFPLDIFPDRRWEHLLC